MAKLKNIAGQKFGKLTAISPAFRKSGSVFWECICECGEKTYATYTHLKNGNNKTCGKCTDRSWKNSSRFIDLTGKRYGMLTVIGFAGTKNNNCMWNCKCDCGQFKTVSTNKLSMGKTSSCGCKKIKVNRESTSDLYQHWYAMLNRCRPENTNTKKDYFDRGITVCDDWKLDGGFWAFKEWSLKNGYKEGLTLDRINNDCGYSPNNCRWTTQKEQQNNKTNNHYITYKGVTKTMKQWSESTGIGYSKLRHRIYANWDIDRVFETP